MLLFRSWVSVTTFVRRLARDTEERIRRRRMRPLYMSILLMGLFTVSSQARGQIYPDPRMTRVFEDRMKAFAKSHTRVFVSDCNLLPAGKEKAVLVIPLGTSLGTVVLATEGDVYNGAGVRFDNNGPVLENPGGGEWSYRRLSGITAQLVKFRFALMQPEDVTGLLGNTSSNDCAEPAKRQNF